MTPSSRGSNSLLTRVVWFNENLETVGSFLTVSMDAAGGTGVMADIITVKKGGEFELPACEFAPESGSEFVGWGAFDPRGGMTQRWNDHVQFI